MLILTSCGDDPAVVVVEEDVLPHAVSMKHTMERTKKARRDRFILLFSSFLHRKQTTASYCSVAPLALYGIVIKYTLAEVWILLQGERGTVATGIWFVVKFVPVEDMSLMTRKEGQHHASIRNWLALL